MTNDWQLNTAQNPFYIESVKQCKSIPVEVEYDNGRVEVLGCPRCCRSRMPFIKKWREMSEEDYNAFILESNRGTVLKSNLTVENERCL